MEQKLEIYKIKLHSTISNPKEKQYNNVFFKTNLKNK